MDRIDKQRAQRVCDRIKNSHRLIEASHLSENPEFERDTHSRSFGMATQAGEFGCSCRMIGIGRDAQHMLCAKLRTNIDAPAVIVEIAVGLDPDDFDIDQL